MQLKSSYVTPSVARIKHACTPSHLILARDVHADICRRPLGRRDIDPARGDILALLRALQVDDDGALGARRRPGHVDIYMP